MSSYDDLAASSVNTATQTISIVTIVFQILSTAGAVMISQYLGAGKRRDASLVSVLLITSQLFFGVIISVIFLLFNRPVLMLIGADGQILEYASGYLFIVGGTMMFQALMNACAVIGRTGRRDCNRRQPYHQQYCSFDHPVQKDRVAVRAQTAQAVSER